MSKISGYEPRQSEVLIFGELPYTGLSGLTWLRINVLQGSLVPVCISAGSADLGEDVTFVSQQPVLDGVEVFIAETMYTLSIPNLLLLQAATCQLLCANDDD